jgi:L-lactate dehydrogenase complex protein LldG
MSSAESLFQQFEQKAGELPATVLRTNNPENAAELLVQQIQQFKPRQIAATSLSYLGDHVKRLGTFSASNNIDFTMGFHPDKIEQADIGISQGQFGVAQLGTILHDTGNIHSRMVSMLPPVHIVLLPTNELVPGFADALNRVQQRYHSQLPAYLSFITGPSKTADIERQLTIGVHGPGTLIVIFIDEPVIEESHD